VKLEKAMETPLSNWEKLRKNLQSNRSKPKSKP